MLEYFEEAQTHVRMGMGRVDPLGLWPNPKKNRAVGPVGCGLLYTDLVGAEHGAAHPGRCWARPTIPDRLFYFAVGCGG
jgi:hypothetical protein